MISLQKLSDQKRELSPRKISKRLPNETVNEKLIKSSKTITDELAKTTEALEEIGGNEPTNPQKNTHV